MAFRPRSLAVFLTVFTIPAISAYLAESQGINLLDDGLWLLGTRTIAQGGHLYRDLFSIYGPANYYVLLPFFLVFGSSIHTLVLFKSVMAGSSSILAFVAAHRFGAKRLAWLLPLGVLALGPIPPRYTCALVFALLCCRVASGDGRQLTKGLLLGLAWGGLALFGLDMAVHGAIIAIVGTAPYFRADPRTIRVSSRWRVGFLTGAGGVAVAAVLIALATGSLSAAIWDTIICPLTYSPHHFGWTNISALVHPLGSEKAFSQVFTGENLGPAWPGHAWLRGRSIQAMVVLIIAAPVIATVWRRRTASLQLAPIVGLALCGWSTAFWRPDVAHVLAVFPGALLLMVCLPGQGHPPRASAVRAVVLLLVSVMAPPAGERIWLVAHRNRPGIEHWDRSTAGISMARSRRDALEQLLAVIDTDGNQPTIAWPAQPGLVFLSGKSLATRQVTLLAGSVRDESSVIDDLRRNDPDRLVLGRVAGLAPDARSMESLAPSIWTYLRSNFFIESQIADGGEGFQVVHRIKTSGLNLEDIPLDRRLPGASQLVKNSRTPALHPGMVVGQTMRIGNLDLQGLALLVAATGPLPAELAMDLEVKAVLADGAAHPSAHFKSRVLLDQHIQPCTLAFPAIPNSAGEFVLLELTVTADPTCQVHLLWHDSRADSGESVDYYPEGHALLNGKPVDADLFFISY